MEYPNEWKEVDGMLVKTFELNNFKEAVKFVNKIAPIAEDMNHHPDIEIFSYKMVRIRLKTHSENKITRKDILFAKKIDEIRVNWPKIFLQE